MDGQDILPHSGCRNSVGGLRGDLVDNDRMVDMMVKIEYKPTDTTEMQLRSVVVMAKRFGWHFNGRSFSKFNQTCRHMEHMSFTDMQRVHNTGRYAMVGGDSNKMSPYGGLNIMWKGYWYQVPLTNKLVERSKLQWHKKLKKFVAQEFKVKLV